VASTICSVALPDSLICLGIGLVIPKLYINSVLAVINSRRGLQERAFQGLVVGSTGLDTLPTSWLTAQLTIPYSEQSSHDVIQTIPPGQRSHVVSLPHQPAPCIMETKPT